MVPLRSRVCVEVAPRSVSATIERRGRIEWAHRETFDDLGEALARIVASMPRRRRGIAVRVVVQPPLAYVKRLDGLPQAANRRMLDAIVRENASAFFVMRDAVVTDIDVGGDGTTCGGAIDGAVVHTLVKTFARPAFVLDSIGPVDCALTHRPHDARGGAMLTRLAQTAAVLVLLLTMLGAAFAPGMRATRDLRVARKHLAAIAPPPSTQLQADVRTATQLLDTYARFISERGSTTRLLTELTRALPDSAALVSLRIDSLDVAFVATAPQVASVLSELVGIPATATPKITTQATREVVSGVKLERASFRLRRLRAPKG